MRFGRENAPVPCMFCLLIAFEIWNYLSSNEDNGFSFPVLSFNVFGYFAATLEEVKAKDTFL